jgi:Asp-tRNA(Asn)/Glu-tRNA(Gln) amidotransferase A subunit family amidase
MGFTGEDLPSGLQIVGKPWSEPELIEIAHGYELATRHRHPPSTVPSLVENLRTQRTSRKQY